MAKTMQLYPPRADSEMVQTVHGAMTYKDYLQVEKKRIERNPARTAQIVSRFGWSWLMVNRISERKKSPSSRWPSLMPLGQRKVMAL